MNDGAGEVLALLTAGRGWTADAAHSSISSNAGTRPSDVAAALARVRPRITADLLLVVYCDHPRADLVERLVPWLSRLHPISLPVRFQDRLPTLIELALVDLRSPLVCPSCQGRGWVRDRRECQSCGGSGQLTKQRGVFLAKQFGVSKATWSECWAWRYQQLFRLLSQQITDGLFQLQQALGDCNNYK